MPRLFDQPAGAVELEAEGVDAIEHDGLRGPSGILRPPPRGSMEQLNIEPDEIRIADNVDQHDETNLIAPPPRSGMHQRWIRVQNPDGQVDMRNYMRAVRNGYAPRDPKTIRLNGNEMPKRTFEGIDVFQVGDLVLMEIDLARRAALLQLVENNRKRLHQIMTNDHEQASAEGIRDGMSPIVREEQVTTGTRPPIMAN